MRPKLKLIALTIILALSAGLSAGIASAEEKTVVDVGGRKLNIISPDGFCLPKDSEPTDRQMVTMLRDATKSVGELLMTAWECEPLAKVRMGIPMMMENVQAQVLHQFKAQDFKGFEKEIVKSACAAFKTMGDKGVSDAVAAQKGEAEAATKDRIKLGKTGPLGVLKETPQACYVGIVQEIALQGKTVSALIVQAITVLNGRALYLTYSAEAKDGQVERLIGLMDKIIAANIAANKG
jgi:hypothetical protein